MTADRAVRVVVAGLVQGVGYRAWTEAEALRRGLAGWVRNRRDGTVEAVFVGDAAAVDAMVAACARGPLGADATSVDAAEYDGPPLGGFTVLSTE